ncbi:hypothetical protein HMPREF1362_00111, partial [Enterococcus faecium ERV102]
MAEILKNIVEILNAVVMTKVTPARIIIVLNKRIIALLPKLSYVGNIDNKKLMGRNIAKIMKRICENNIIPVRRNTKKEIPILNNTKKTTVPKRFMVLVILRF